MWNNFAQNKKLSQMPKSIFFFNHARPSSSSFAATGNGSSDHLLQSRHASCCQIWPLHRKPHSRLLPPPFRPPLFPLHCSDPYSPSIVAAENLPPAATASIPTFHRDSCIAFHTSVAHGAKPSSSPIVLDLKKNGALIWRRRRCSEDPSPTEVREEEEERCCYWRRRRLAVIEEEGRRRHAVIEEWRRRRRVCLGLG